MRLMGVIFLVSILAFAVGLTALAFVVIE